MRDSDILDVATETASGQATDLDYSADMIEWDDNLIYKRGMYLCRITPEIAESLLERNTNNRRPKERAILKYARAMTEGIWDPDANAIKLSRDGELIDGQNRLLACQEAGVPFDTWVLTGCSTKTKSKVDTGIARSAADAIKMELQATYPTTIGASVSLRVRYENGAHMNQTKRQLETVRIALSHDEILGYVQEHDSIPNMAIEAHSIRRQVLPSIPQSSICAFLSMAHEVDAEDTEKFMGKLTSGEFGGAGDPLLALVNYAAFVKVINTQGSPGHMGRAAAEGHLLAICRVWNAWRANQSFDRRLVIKATDRLQMPV